MEAYGCCNGAADGAVVGFPAWWLLSAMLLQKVAAGARFAGAGVNEDGGFAAV